jgi:branched-chain amino acid transport system substrate-binding protein
VQFVAEQWPALGKLEAGPTVQALAAAEPEAIYNATFGGDLVKFVREGDTRGLFEGREVVSLLTGEPEYLDPLGAEAPEGWLVTGYPWSKIETPEHTAFLEAFQARWNEPPKLGAVVGYAMIHSIAAMLDQAGSTDTDGHLDRGIGTAMGCAQWLGVAAVAGDRGPEPLWRDRAGQDHRRTLDGQSHHQLSDKRQAGREVQRC